MSASLVIRHYDPAQHEEAVFALWQRALGPVWPITRAAFHHVTVGSAAYQPGDHLVAEAGAGIIGFAGTQVRTIPDGSPPRGELMVVLVDPAHQRQGIGRALLERALASLEERGVAGVQLGGGGLSYFWPGVPENLPGAWAFFRARGWRETERSFDLVRELEGYTTPPGIYERIRLPGVTITTAAPEDVPAVLAFEERHFPGWLHAYQRAAAHGACGDLVLARDARGDVLGTSMVLDARSEWRGHGFKWEMLLGASTGGVGPLGVREDARGNGVGLALAARVTELLRERGLATSYVGWTWLVDWYGMLGYRVWREYRMARG